MTLRRAGWAGILLLGLASLPACDVEKFVDQVSQEATNQLAREAKKQLRRQLNPKPGREQQEPVDEPTAPVGQTVLASDPPARDRDTLTLASFNIQVLGTSKLRKTDVVPILADVVRRYDLVAIQELRSKDNTVIPRFLSAVNAQGARYDAVIGPRLGRTMSKEQYVFLFDTTRIEVDRRSVYTVPDPHDLLHREPLVATFRARGLPPHQAFTFKLVNIHTDPDETDQELDALASVFAAVQRDGSGEDDVILLGDLNVSARKLGRLGQLPGIRWVIGSGTMTNTRLSKSYDNMVFDARLTSEFRGYGGVLNLRDAYQLSLPQALRVSDHMPVWAQFSVYEGATPGPIATRPRSPKTAR